MRPVDWADQVNDRLASLDHAFKLFPHHFDLTIDGKRIIIPRVDLGLQYDPLTWFVQRHSDDMLHEPGMIAWLLALADRYSNRHVRFYDIGALYGYFGAIAAQAFARREVLVVEANPGSAKFAERIMRANKFSDTIVRNMLVGASKGPREFTIDGYQITPSESGPDSVTIETAPLADILQPADHEAIDILKVDVEGFQAEFLPPATDELIRRRAILLLELDEPEKMARFGRANADLVQPFIEAGYALYWSDHRQPDGMIQHLAKLQPEHERNSLAVLLPPEEGSHIQ